MRHSHAHLSVSGLLTAAALAGALSSPTAKLDNAIFTGSSDGLVNQFLGIPFAKPPTGNLRFNTPVLVDPYHGSHSAVDFGPWCPQQNMVPRIPPDLVLPDSSLQMIQKLVNLGGNSSIPESEDCLSLNVITPTKVRRGTKLPVLVWVHGGGFEGGAASLYPGANIVKRSAELDEPVIYVSMNYRLTAFGFLAGKEVKKAGVGNLGLHDQRLALRWVHKYISAFGGDPTKVTIWGESAGAMSVALHMLTNQGNTDGLFRGAFMQSGGPIPTGYLEDGQADYDALVKKTGCAGSEDTLACLRHADYAMLKKAVDESPSVNDAQSLRLAWVPRADGKFLTATPMELVLQGSVANIPFVTGSCDDEGTSFAFSTLNITTDEEFRNYAVSNYFPKVPQGDVNRLLELYSSDPAKGSPFGTGTSSMLTPQFKRSAALQGDWILHAPRRFILKHRADKQKTWSYLSKRYKDVPIFGSTHGVDLPDVFVRGELMDYLIHFANHLDPNGRACNTSVAWPRYRAAAPRLLTLVDGERRPVTFTYDTFRMEGMELLHKIGLDYPV